MARAKGPASETPRDLEHALTRIVAMVNASEQSSMKVREKLLRAGFPEAVVEDALERARELSYIDDERYSNMLIRSKIYAGKGLQQARREIESLGLDPQSLEAWCEYCEEGEEAEVERALTLLNRKPPHSKNLRDGAFRKLVSQGYSVSIASEAARQWVESQQS